VRRRIRIDQFVEHIQMALLVARLARRDDARSLEIVAANPMACGLAPMKLSRSKPKPGLVWRCCAASSRPRRA